MPITVSTKQLLDGTVRAVEKSGDVITVRFDVADMQLEAFIRPAAGPDDTFGDVVLGGVTYTAGTKPWQKLYPVVQHLLAATDWALAAA
jgi:hypothetical protein